MLVFHSKQDNMCEPEGSEMLCAAAGSQDVTLENAVCEGMWHALLIEPGKARVFMKLTSWLKAHTP